MLDALDDVPWSDLTHADGPADDVPAHLRALLSPDPEVRAKALHRCYGTIVHQGTRYEASAFAVPFLLETAAQETTPDRPALIELLVALAIGSDESRLPGAFPVADLRAAAQRDSAQASVDLAAYDAAGEGVPLYIQLLRDPGPAVRRWSACALGWFPEQAAWSRPALTAAITDDDPSVAATAVLALGLSGAGLPDDVFGSSTGIVRAAAAIALARLHGPRTPPAVTDELRRWSGGDVLPGPTDVPYHEGDLAGYAALALRQVLPAGSGAALDDQLGRLPAVSGSEALPVVDED